MPEAKPSAAPWKPKSSVAGSRPSVVYRLMEAGLPSNTSPNMKKSSFPAALACSIRAGPKLRQNGRLTCLTVSIRNPSMPRSTHAL